MEKQFIIIAREHRVWGTVLSPCIAEVIPGKTFLLIKCYLTKEAIVSNAFPLSTFQKKVIKILDNYSDLALMRLFDRKSTNVQSFLSMVTKEKTDTVIRPFIESKVKEVIELLLDNEEGIPLYYKKDDLLTLHSADLIKLEKEEAAVVFNFKKVESGIQYYLTIKLEDKTHQLMRRNGVCLVNTPCFTIIDNHLLHFKDLDFKKLVPFFSKEYVQIPKSSERVYLETFVFKAIRKFNVEVEGFTLNTINETPKIHLSLVRDIYNRVLLNVGFQYLGIRFNNQQTIQCEVTLEKEGESVIFNRICRDVPAEQEVVNSLLLLSLYEVEGGLLAVKQGDVKDLHTSVLWLNEHSEQLNKMNVTVDSRLQGKRYFVKSVSLDIQLEDKNDWFDVFGNVSFGEFVFPFVKLRKHIVMGKREFELPNGEIAILPEEWFSEYQGMMLMGNEKQGHLKLRKYHFNTLSSQVQGVNLEVFNNLKKLSQQHICVENPPSGLNATLRSYQQVGFSWLVHLQNCGFGGCLADDMGLGKTLQTLALLQHSIKSRYSDKCQSDPFDDGVPGPILKLDSQGRPLKGGMEVTSRIKESTYSPASLIVMPVSLIDNWENEIKKFTPTLSVYKYVGVNRVKELSNLDAYDIVLTSYGIVRNDISFLETYGFYYLVLDESQYMKNPNSKVYHAVNKLSAQKKMVLTGTPIENSLLDLWTQLNFLNKGMLGNLSFFKNEFLVPIERNKDEAKQLKLKKLIEPFLLRRTKQEVAKDLPPLTEQIMYAEMTEEQSKLYEKEKSVVRNLIFDNVEKEGVGKSSIVILKSLTRLRQIANHPQLVENDEAFSSGKFEMVLNYLNNLLEGKNKVLIYSSFVKHLNLFESYFKEKGLKYTKLVGNTNNRQREVDLFQENEDIRLFLISLKAGGVGLNLTAADYVFILDPWWNPAAESQAIARAHRIGQDKNVFVYRFITKGSIEEKIVTLQQKKNLLAESFVGTSNPFQALSRESIEELLK